MHQIDPELQNWGVWVSRSVACASTVSVHFFCGVKPDGLLDVLQMWWLASRPDHHYSQLSAQWMARPLCQQQSAPHC